MTPLELHWLAGLLEGEGSFCKGPPSAPRQPQISIQMTDEDVISRVAALFGVAYNGNQPRKRKWKIAFRATLRGKSAVDLMLELHPLMGSRRKAQIDAAVATFRLNPKHWRHRVMPPSESLIQMSREGYSLREVGRAFGVSHQHVARVLGM